MGITELELDQRKFLLGLTPDLEATLISYRAIADANIDGLVHDFYRQQLVEPEIRAIIGDSDTFSRLKGAMRGYVLRLFAGNYDLNYANPRLRVGQVHARIGVPPKLYVSSLHLLEQLILEKILRKSSHAADLAMRKLLLLDLQFAFDAYVNGLVSKVELANGAIRLFSESFERTLNERTEIARRISETDALSGLATRHRFDGCLQREWEIARATDSTFCLAILDIDEFKRINDSLGHLKGDSIVRLLGDIIISSIRRSDSAFRIGGDEFCLMFPATTLADAIAFCENINALCIASEVPFSVSFGVRSSSDLSDRSMASELLEDADRLLMAMKQSKKGAPVVSLLSGPI